MNLKNNEVQVSQASRQGTKGQSHWLTHFTTNQHCYKIKSFSLVKHTFKNTTQLLKTSFCEPIAYKYYISSLIYSIVFTAVSDFSAWKRLTWQFPYNFPDHTQVEVSIWSAQNTEKFSFFLEIMTLPSNARLKRWVDSRLFFTLLIL